MDRDQGLAPVSIFITCKNMKSWIIQFFILAFFVHRHNASFVTGQTVWVYGTLGSGLNIRDSPCTNGTVVVHGLEGDMFTVTEGPISACGYVWYKLDDLGWGADAYLQLIGGPGYIWNRYGIGLVSEGNTQQLDYTHNLAGDNGWVLLIFAGVDTNTQGPVQSWVDSVNAAYDRLLNVVVRVGPAWGATHYRDLSDDSSHMVYSSLAQAFKRVIQGIPLRSDRNLFIQIDNECDLCYEWFCGTPESQPLTYNQIASEYAHFLSYVIDAINSIGDPRLRVSLGALAPGGALQCGCCGADNCPGDSAGITGLQFMQAMMQAVPNIFNKIHFLTTHSYPAQGIGWGFNVPYDQAMPGLTYYQLELETIHRKIPVVITETGWATHRDGLPPCTEDDKAQWYSQAWSNVWNADNRIIGVTPFMLMDSYWGDQCGYSFVTTSGGLLPVYTTIQQQRCKLGFGPC